jgi:hypothetical protein
LPWKRFLRKAMITLAVVILSVYAVYQLTEA